VNDAIRFGGAGQAGRLHNGSLDCPARVAQCGCGGDERAFL